MVLAQPKGLDIMLISEYDHNTTVQRDVEFCRIFPTELWHSHPEYGSSFVAEYDSIANAMVAMANDDYGWDIYIIISGFLICGGEFQYKSVTVHKYE